MHKKDQMTKKVVFLLLKTKILFQFDSLLLNIDFFFPRVCFVFLVLIFFKKKNKYIEIEKTREKF